MHVASLLGNVLWLVSLVQQAGAQPLNNVDGFGVTPLRYASSGGHTKAVILIIDHFDMEQYGRALWFAMIAGSASVACLLVEKGADVDLHGGTNQELIDLTCDGGNGDNNIIMNTGQKSISLHLNAIEDCHPEIVQILLDNMWRMVNQQFAMQQPMATRKAMNCEVRIVPTLMVMKMGISAL
jgi:ankyrin repeat protein